MKDNSVLSIETPSGKDAAYENFPVGSWLLPANLRRHIYIFYEFARTIDDIADSPNLPPDEKIRRLEGFELVLKSGKDPQGVFGTSIRMRESLKQTTITDQHCLDLLIAEVTIFFFEFFYVFSVENFVRCIILPGHKSKLTCWV